MYNNSMELLKTRASRRMDTLFLTGYPHPINLFAALMLTLLPVLSPFARMSGNRFIATTSSGWAGLLALLYLVLWSRLRAVNPERTLGFFWVYLLGQTAVVSLIYALDGGLTRFLFVVVAVQAVYISPVRRWAPYLGTLATLWLTLYLVISPDPGSGKVATIGMYLCYLIFAALVTFTTVQQERQNQVAQELLDGVDRRYHALRALDLTVEDRTEVEERERLAQTIWATLLSRMTSLRLALARILTGQVPLDRESTRTARLEAKAVLAAVREAVRTLRPGEDAEIDDEEEERFNSSPQPEVAQKWTNPIRLYHIWNVGVIVVTTGVIVASLLVAGNHRWGPLLGMGVVLLAAYTETATARQPWSRSLYLVLQAGLIIWIVAYANEPLMSHLFLIVAAQMVFLVPVVTRWLVASVLFPTLLSGVALWLISSDPNHPVLVPALVAAFGVTNFFGAVMAFMTRRHVEARERAVDYAQQVAEINRLLEARLQEVRRMAIARERVRMSREIHDGLGHHLTIIIVELQYAEQLAEEDSGAARQHLEIAQEMIRVGMDSSREMVESLDRFDRPLTVALADLVAAWQKGNDISVRTRVDGDFSALSTASRITIYRAVQESLTNIQKHARATEVKIILRQLPDRVALTITNDDKGGAPPFIAGRSGFGLLGLRERADALQGEFSAGRRPDGSYKVKLVLPLGA